ARHGVGGPAPVASARTRAKELALRHEPRARAAVRVGAGPTPCRAAPPSPRATRLGRPARGCAPQSVGAGWSDQGSTDVNKHAWTAMVGALAAAACSNGAGPVPAVAPGTPSAPPAPVAATAPVAPVATVVVGADASASPSAEPAPSASDDDPDAEGEGGVGTRSKGEEGTMGDPDASGIGSMWGDSIGEAFGAGGLGLTGLGPGGGGTGEGIGLGSIGSIGHGAGTGTGQGFGSGGAGRLGTPRQKPPQVRMGKVTVTGQLPPEVVQRIVRQNFGRFRMCYELGLRGNPKLAGTVAVTFVIGADGAVSRAAPGGDLPDAGVVACVTRAFYGLSFPQPDSGTVKVVYPIGFAPPEAASPTPSPATPAAPAATAAPAAPPGTSASP
ncbi:MAG: AgmX/PglI C-terminal domain-containing protein, partial [Myxococcales bacterium]|nr:AgmX/PglI C-terminal domain-containing protein [Myxococcales bacterium]